MQPISPICGPEKKSGDGTQKNHRRAQLTEIKLNIPALQLIRQDARLARQDAQANLQEAQWRHQLPPCEIARLFEAPQGRCERPADCEAGRHEEKEGPAAR